MAKNLTKLICSLLIIAIAAYIALCGIGKFMPGVFEEGAIRKGLDLAGGTLLVYEPDLEDASKVESDDYNAVVAVLTRRLSKAGYTEASLTQLKDEGRIQIEIPEEKDISKARDLLGNTGELTFVSADGTVVLTGSDIKSAKNMYDYVDENSVVPAHFVQLTLKSDAVDKFADATLAASSKENISSEKNYIRIMLDDDEVSKPYVWEQLVLEDVVITGNFTEESAKDLASIISSGQLPFKLREIRADTVGPTLGEKALETAIMAGAIGIALVALFMIIVYRLPGFVSVIALAAYMAIEAIVLVVTKVNLSLPGVAGIVLSIGMAVDANVIINERIKEEIRAGKGTISAVKSGFKGAFTSIVDSNVTTIIASVVLWIFGTGTVQGFAITLFIGIVASMFTALVVTRFIMTTVAKLGLTNPKLYGI